MPLSGAAHSWLPTPSANRLLSREFEDGTVCFDPDTGETLLLSPLAGFLLECWAPGAARPMSDAELLAQVLAINDSATEADVAQALVEQALSELHRAGFVTHGT
ncbi:MAG: HPr-rel-A system PqqD family peptide chaperone [Rubrivivax sp.]|nr:MAG: HPr-rel-A system PqqD family peptide chaperone [Rubrivivax sp.]